MKKSVVLFTIPSLLILLLSTIYPIFMILVYIKDFNSKNFSFGIIGYLFLVVILSVIIFIEFIYLLYKLYNLEKNIFFKIIWTLLLIVFNILIFPFFYSKYVANRSKNLFIYIVLLIPMLFFISTFAVGEVIYFDKVNQKEQKKIKIENERIDYNTKDDAVSFTFRHGYEKKEIGEYDLYVINEEKNIVFTAFTYDTFYYEQKSKDDFIEKGIKDVSIGKENFDIYKEKENIDLDNISITTVSYKGKTSTSSECIYKISAITYNSKANYIVYVVEVITEANYDKYSDELLEILKSSKIN